MLSHLKALAKRIPIAWNAYQTVKQQVLRATKALYYLSDIRSVWRHMIWREDNTQYWPLSAELLFQYHKLEKGLVMPGKPRLFGTDPVRATMRLAAAWEGSGHAIDDPIYLGALVSVDAYRQRLVDLGLDRDSPAFNEVTAFVMHRQSAIDASRPALNTPMNLPTAQADTGASASVAFAQLAHARRSVRDFIAKPVPLDHVAEAIRIAALAPSACNRQPNRVSLVQSPERIAAALALQNGNRGFGDRVPLLAVLAVDQTGFFDGSERHQPYIDGGLFAMSLILALRSQDISSCCLNWCVPPSIDRQLHVLLGLPDSERVVMLLAIGYAPEGTMVPRSPRRSQEQVLRLI